MKWNPTVSIADSAASHADSSNGRQDVPSQILLVPRSNLFMPLLTMNYDHLSWDRAPLSVDIGSSRWCVRILVVSYLIFKLDPCKESAGHRWDAYSNLIIFLIVTLISLDQT